jgi:SAM-dependent methyltransferase
MKHALIILGAVVLLSAATGAQAPQAKPAPTLRSLAGRYEGTATSPQGTTKVTADLREADGKITGSLDSGDGPIAITGATLTGDAVVLTLDMNGNPGTISGAVKDGRIDGEWTLGGMTGTCALTRTGDAAPAPAGAQAKRPASATHPRLDVVVPDFPAQGLILDIGGGGEGVIGQLKGQQVVAIDLLKQELDDAPGRPLLKIVMDARDLKFVDASFPTATVFFTFMYIDPADHEKVFREIHRVLGPGGRLLVWDPIFPEKRDPAHATILFPLRVKLPAKEFGTGYGARFREGQGADHFVGVAEKAGFQVVSRKNEAGWFFLELKK